MPKKVLVCSNNQQFEVGSINLSFGETMLKKFLFLISLVFIFSHGGINRSYGYAKKMMNETMGLFCQESYHLLPFNTENFQFGDMILQPMEGKMASLIEDEENSFFSHVGIILKIENGQVWIAEAYTSSGVSLIPLRKFMDKNDPLRPAVVIRHIASSKIMSHQEEILERFIKEYQGKNYNYKFNWDEKDSLYCSQMITLLLNPYLNEKEKIKTKSMTFSKNWEEWKNVLKQDPPTGKRGNSPGDFDHDRNFIKMGCLGNMSL